MRSKHNKEIASTAKMLRKNMTKEEKHLWYDFLSTYPVRFYRQKVLGKYIVDFYCAKVKLVLELDGSQHSTPDGMRSDAERSDWLAGYGLKILRIKNVHITENFEWVCACIDDAVQQVLLQ